MKVLRDVFQIVLEVPTNSYAENIRAKFNGVEMTSLDGDHIIINNRTYEVVVEQVGGGKCNVIIYVVNNGSEIEDRIDYMLEEEYEMKPLVEITTKSSNTILPWTINYRQSMQTVRMMDMDMAPGVKDAIDYLTSSAVDFDEAFIGKLVQELNTGKHQDVLDFINKLSEL